MSLDHISINISSVYVEGIDSVKRSKSIRDLILCRKSKIVSTIPILHDINFSAKNGDRIAFIGTNGSGKSSLLKVIAGIYPVKSGKVYVNGRIAAIIEMGIGFEPDMTGRENIELVLAYNGIIDQYTKELEEDIIDFSELGDKIDWPLKTYSSGMLARLSFSISIMQDPEILLLDEVFAAGDQHFLNKALVRMKNKFSSSPISILVSHQHELIREICNRCVLLENGRIIDDGKPDMILSKYEAMDI